MKINIYYGGRGLLDDPTLYVIKKMEEVLNELRVTVERYSIYEHKYEISTLPNTFKEADAIILAASVEWMGIGGYMHQFLDACYLYADKEKLANLYMQPVVISTTYGEKEGMMTLENAWEMLGGELHQGLCGYVQDLISFELNKDYAQIIEKRAENLYRCVSQKTKNLPVSSKTVGQSVSRPKAMVLTPEETEQLSKYASNDTYVKKQKEDIQELSSVFKNLLGEGEKKEDSLLTNFKRRFKGVADFAATYSFEVEGRENPFCIHVVGEELSFKLSSEEVAEVSGKIKEEVLEQIMDGKMTFQRAFMVGEMTAKGNFKILTMLDTLFQFSS